MTAFDVALGAVDEFVHAIGLVVIKFQGLRDAGVGNVEIHVILEVGGGVGCAKLLPP